MVCWDRPKLESKSNELPSTIMTRIFFLVMRIIISEDGTFQKHSAKQLPFILHVRTNNKKGNDQRGGRIQDNAAGMKNVCTTWSTLSDLMLRWEEPLCCVIASQLKALVSAHSRFTQSHTVAHAQWQCYLKMSWALPQNCLAIRVNCWPVGTSIDSHLALSIPLSSGWNVLWMACFLATA